MTPRLALMLIALPFALQAQKAPASYQAVMRAQYDARTAQEPLGPAEARRIYDAYLSGLGKPAQNNPAKNSTHSGESAGMPSR